MLYSPTTLLNLPVAVMAYRRVLLIMPQLEISSKNMSLRENITRCLKRRKKGGRSQRLKAWPKALKAESTGKSVLNYCTEIQLYIRHSFIRIWCQLLCAIGIFRYWTGKKIRTAKREARSELSVSKGEWCDDNPRMRPCMSPLHGCSYLICSSLKHMIPYHHLI